VLLSNAGCGRCAGLEIWREFTERKWGWQARTAGQRPRGGRRAGAITRAGRPRSWPWPAATAQRAARR